MLRDIEIYQKYDELGSQEKTAEALGTTRWRVRKALEDRPEIPPLNSDGTLTLKTTDRRVRSLEDLLAYYGVNLDRFQIDRWKANYWESGAFFEGNWDITPLHQVWAQLSPIREAYDGEAIKEDVLDFIAERASGAVRKGRARGAPSGAFTEPSLYVLATPDVHMGKLSWGEEAGEDYDLDIATDGFLSTVDRLLDQVRDRNVERVLCVVGNDLLHTDNTEGTTTAGTYVDADSRHQKVFSRAWRAQVKAIDKMLEVAPVDVLVVPGNHDRDSVYKLGEVIAAWYRSEDHVDVDNSPSHRKYYRYGPTLLGLTHGDQEKETTLPLIMASERPQDFAECSHKEWLLGHRHKKAETRYFAGDTHKGVRVRRLSALTATDAWHYQKGFVGGGRSAEGFLFGKEKGYVGHFEEWA